MPSHDTASVPSLNQYNVANRRDRIRVDVLGQVEAHSVWRLKPIFLRDLSDRGFSLESTSPFETGLVHKFRLGIEGHRRSVVVQATAMHCKLQSMSADLPIYIAGFALFEPSDAVKREMLALVRFAESLWTDDNGPTDATR